MNGPESAVMQRPQFHRSLPGVDNVQFASLIAAEHGGCGPISRLPYSTRVLIENLLRNEVFGPTETASLVRALATRNHHGRTFPFMPGRLLMQDSSGLPVLADLIDLAQRVTERGGDPVGVAPQMRMDLVVDHAVEVDHWGTPDAAAHNLSEELLRHAQRYRFLRQAQRLVPNLRVFPSGVGICHQINLEFLAEVVHVDAPATASDGAAVAGFDTLLGTDSHTTMINALTVFGWGVGGIEATAALLGEPVMCSAPRVTGVRLIGCLRPGILATDLALTLTALLRKHDLIGQFVEFCGPGVATLAVPDRATLANMAPEYGATMAFFPADVRTLQYLRDTGRPEAHISMLATYLAEQGMLWDSAAPEPQFDSVIEFDMSAIEPTVSGPSRPEQAMRLSEVPASVKHTGTETTTAADASDGTPPMQSGAIVIAAITSCTNTSNPRALLAAGLLARNARRRGLRVPWYTKTSFAPGSLSASRLLDAAGLQPYLDQLGFNVVGHGCTTCMGNSGPLTSEVEELIAEHDLSVAAVLSGNRNFAGRIHPSARLNYLVSPPLVVAFALAGTVTRDISAEPLGIDTQGEPVFLADLWPAESEINDFAVTPGLTALAARAFHELDERIASHTDTETDDAPTWGAEADMIRRPPFLEPRYAQPLHHNDIIGARPLLVLGDAITTDDISPVSRILPRSEAGRWLASHGVTPQHMASYSARRLNHDVMVRGGFANPRITNQMAPQHPGGQTRLMPDDSVMPVHEAAAEYERRGVPVVVVAGRRYGAGSARDWAAKVTRMLRVRAVLAQGFERIHRANLIAMGVLPVLIESDLSTQLDGSETLDLTGLRDGLTPGGRLTVTVRRNGQTLIEFVAKAHIQTQTEVTWLHAGGVLPKALSTHTAAH